MSARSDEHVRGRLAQWVRWWREPGHPDTDSPPPDRHPLINEYEDRELKRIAHEVCNIMGTVAYRE